MSQPAICVEDLWKQYHLGRTGGPLTTFYDVLSHAIVKPFRRQRDGDADATRSDPFWALRGVNFEIEPGDVVGVIGRNGAGKSTLLKTLSRITAPTQGRLTIRGRLASLLEVGTGFHPELTGRENIFLNGAILGMTRREMQRKCDDIIAFAEVADFIDTPVKRYSSGMYVRLAFSVAAHLENDVLLIDEVLAVGDSSFQRKCLTRMGDVARGGKTVFFVSHNLAAVRNLCSRVLMLDHGQLVFDGPVDEGLGIYERACAEPGRDFAPGNFKGPLQDRLRFDRLVCRQGGERVDVVDPLEEFRIELCGEVVSPFPRLNINLKIHRDGVYLGSCFDAEPDQPMSAGRFVSVFDVPAGVFRPGRYTIGIGASAAMGEWMFGPDICAIDFSQSRAESGEDRSSGVLAIPYRGARQQDLPDGL